MSAKPEQFSDTIAPTPAPMTGRERLEAQFPHIIDTNHDEDQLAAQNSSIVDAANDERSRNQIEIADENIVAVQNERSQKPSKAVEERTEKRLAALKAKRLDIDAREKQQLESTPGSLRNAIREFMNSSAAYERYIHANTSAEINEGESLADAMKRVRAAWHEQRAKKQAIIKAPLTADDIVLNASDYVRRLAVNVDQILGGLRHARFDERFQTFSQRRPEAPKTSKGEIDALGVMAAAMGEPLAAALATMALQGHNESDALGYAERDAMMRATNAEIERLEYQAAAIHRLARKRGENAGPRMTGNVLAALDLKKV